MANDRQPDTTPQFPAATSPADEPGSGEERLKPPSTAGQALIAAHLADRHGIEPFSLVDHVHLGGPRPESQLITWHPANASFHCERCPGMVFATGEITPEQIQLTQMFDEGLRVFLRGAHTAEERDEITRRYLDHSLLDGLLTQTSKQQRRKPAPGSRPSVEHRKQRVQAWMLGRYAERGVLERVIEEAEAMQRNDLASWLEIAGVHLAASTLRRYWQEIDDARVEAAKRKYASKS